jgi:hypothetical protein
MVIAIAVRIIGDFFLENVILEKLNLRILDTAFFNLILKYTNRRFQILPKVLFLPFNYDVFAKV